MNIQEKTRKRLDVARKILQEKAIEENGYYVHLTHVKDAGRIAYGAIINLLDNFFDIKNQGLQETDIYEQRLFQISKNLSYAFLNLYQILHLDMAYDRANSVQLSKIGFEEAEKIIGWIEAQPVKG